MILDVVIVDEKGPEVGMDIRRDHVVVREENKDKVLDALKQLTGREFFVFTRKEYLQWAEDNYHYFTRM